MIIELLDGTKYDTEDYNLKRLYHRIPSLQIEHNTSNVNGRGTVILSSALDTRTIAVDFLFQVDDIFDFYLVRDELNNIFVREEEFYIIFKPEPYKKYKVKLANGFLIEPHHIIGAFTVEFIMTNKYAESIASTNSLKEWDINLWAWNNVIKWDTDNKYSFNSNTFTVNNFGTANIDPRESFLNINLNGTFNNFVQIKNLTTNETYRYNGSLNSNEELRIDGVRSFKGQENIFSNTNKRIITLKSGTNDIVVEGGIVSNISFDFNYLFK